MVLPKLNQDRIDAMQQGVMTGVAQVQQKRRRTTRFVAAGFGLIAVLSIATLVGNQFIGDNGSLAFRTSSDSSAWYMSGGSTEVAPDFAADGAGTLPSVTDTGNRQGQGDVDREIIREASLTLVSADIAENMAAIADLTEGYDGYVERMTQINLPQHTPDSSTSSPGFPDGRDIAIYPYYPSQTSMTVRIPADSLEAFIGEVREFGQVQDYQLSQVDITGEVQDIDARIRSLELSIERLEELIADASTTADLIAAEQQLTERQTQLESYQSTRDQYSNQVAMSQVQINFTSTPKPAELEPDGFWGGLITGWNSVVAALGGLIVGLGVILPWLGVGAVLWLLIWGIIRIRRGSKRA